MILPKLFLMRKFIPDLHSRYYTADFSYSDYGINDFDDFRKFYLR